MDTFKVLEKIKKLDLPQLNVFFCLFTKTLQLNKTSAAIGQEGSAFSNGRDF
jgi:hypothetical protein